MANGVDHLSSRDFRRLATFIQDYSGIKMPPTKQTMVEGRLRHRVGATGCANLADYCRLSVRRGGLATEAVHLIDAVTTNKTDFFREPEHFRFLTDTALPRILSERQGGQQHADQALERGLFDRRGALHAGDGDGRWQSAACGGFRISILATDISTRRAADRRSARSIRRR